jgi:hypothetical protein
VLHFQISSDVIAKAEWVKEKRLCFMFCSGQGYPSSIPKDLNLFLIVYRIVLIDTFLGIGLQKVSCQFRYLLSSFFLLFFYLTDLFQISATFLT